MYSTCIKLIKPNVLKLPTKEYQKADLRILVIFLWDRKWPLS